MAIVEAASCGLQVVSTRVGGIPEVLPSNLIILTEPNVDSVLKGLHLAIKRQLLHRQQCTNNGFIKNGSVNLSHNNCNSSSTYNKVKHKPKTPMENGRTIVDKVLCPFHCNEIVGNLYNWYDVSERTENVYRRVLKEPDPMFGDKLRCYQRACVPFLLVVSFCYLFFKFLDWWLPIEHIDIAKDFNDSHRHQKRNHKKRH